MKDLIAKMDALSKDAGLAQLNEDVHVIQPMEAVGEVAEANSYVPTGDIGWHGQKPAGTELRGRAELATLRNRSNPDSGDILGRDKDKAHYGIERKMHLQSKAALPEAEIDEALNHMGEREYQSYHGWKAACRKAGAEWFDGDSDICNAMKGPHPYQRGITRQVGEWDGAVGSVYNIEPTLDEADEQTPVDPYSAGMGSFSRTLRNQPDPSNPHPHGSPEHSNWKFDYDQGREDRYRERGESAVPTGNPIVEDAVLGVPMDQAKVGPKMLAWYRKGNDNTIYYGDKPIASQIPSSEAAKKFALLRSKALAKFGGVKEDQVNEGPDTASDLAKLARVIKSVNSKKQYDAAKAYADLMFHKLANEIKQEKGFGGLSDQTELMDAIQDDLRQLRKRLWPVNSGDTQVAEGEYDREQMGWEEGQAQIEMEKERKRRQTAGSDYERNRSPEDKAASDRHSARIRSNPNGDAEGNDEDLANAHSKMKQMLKQGYEKNAAIGFVSKLFKSLGFSDSYASKVAAQAYNDVSGSAVSEGQVNEIGDTPAGKKALGSYIKKASADAKSRGYDAGATDWSGDEAYKHPEEREWAGMKTDKKAHQRLKGVGQAVDRIVGEARKATFAAGQKAIKNMKKNTQEKEAVAAKKEKGKEVAEAATFQIYKKGSQHNAEWGPAKRMDGSSHSRRSKAEADEIMKNLKRGTNDEYIVSPVKRTSKPAKKVTESKVGTGVTVILEGVRFRVSSPSLAKILRRFPHETENFNQGGELDDHLYNALFDHYSAAGEMPYGVMKARDGDPYNWVTNRLANEMDVNENMTEDVDSGLERIMHHFSHEVEQFRTGGELDNDLYDELYDHYFDEMPYGVKKARSGDPMEWVSDRFEQDLAQSAPLAETERPLVGDAQPDQMMDEAVLMEEPAEEEIAQALQMVGLEDGLDFFFEGGLVVMGRSTAKVAINALRNAGVGTPKIASVDGEEVRITFNKQPAPVVDPRDTLALMNVDESVGGRGYYVVNSMASAQEADGPFQDEQEAWGSVKASYPQQQWANFSVVDYDKLTDLQAREGLGESVVTEGKVKELTQDMKEMSAAEFKAKYKKTKEEWKKNLSQPKEKMDEDVNLNVMATGEEDVLNIIRKLSGMPEVAAVATAIEAPVEETVDVDTPDEGLYSNEPDQHVHTSTTDMINRGDDLNRPKRQYPQAANRAANPMAEARKLMRSYDELMKGVTK